MKRLLALLLCLFVSPVYADVAFDAAVSADPTVNQTSITWEHTVGSGSDRIILIALASGANNPITDAVAPTVDGNPATLLEFRTRDTTSGGTAWRLGIWYYLAPSTGTVTILHNKGTETQHLLGGSISYSGVDQADPFGDSGGAADGLSSPASFTDDIAAAVGDMVVDFIVQNGQATRELVPGANQTERIDVFSMDNSAVPWLKASDEAGAATVTMSWANVDGAVNYTHYAVALNAASGSSDTTPDAFSFTDQTDVTRSTTITSAAVEITGIDATIECEATGGTIDLNEDGNFQTTQDVDNNDTIRARHTSSGSYSTAVNTTVDCNGVSDVFTSTTEAEPDIVATKLIFGSQPGNIVVGQTFGAFTIRAVDSDDALDEDFEDEVTITLQTGDGDLAGTTTQSAVAGIATFDDISINTLNTDAVIRATADGLTSADSDQFDVTAGGEGAAGFPSTSRLGGMLQ